MRPYAWWRKRSPDVVLLDLMLRGGIELMRDIRRVRNVPVIFVSANSQDRLVARAFNNGAADYIKRHS